MSNQRWVTVQIDVVPGNFTILAPRYVSYKWSHSLEGYLVADIIWLHLVREVNAIMSLSHKCVFSLLSVISISISILIKKVSSSWAALLIEAADKYFPANWPTPKKTLKKPSPFWIICMATHVRLSGKKEKLLTEWKKWSRLCAQTRKLALVFRD